jgi:hypothetical protein
MPIPISNVTRRVVYAASGTGPYAFTFEILANTDIAVYKDDALLTLTTDYTVTIASNGTGSITLVAAPTGATQIAIVGNRTIQRTTDFVTGGDFFANTVNDEMDQQTIFAQQNAEGLQRALSAPQTDPTSINMTLPRAALRANKALGFDANGNPAIADTLGTNRGNWAASTLYYVRDIIKDTTNSNIWQCIVQHTSSGSQPIGTNADAAKWTLLVDAAAAATSASNAASSASAASTSASNAASSASAASTSASNASTSASNASSSASAAASSASSAAASYDSFDDRYLGSKSSDPTLDNDSNALIDGALYFDTTNKVMKVYDLANTTWRRTTPTSSDQTNINAAVSNATNINTVAGISANVTTVATNNANVTTVAGNIASVNTNATNIANINQNAANITAIQNASANATAAASSATAAASSATSAASSAAAASAVVLGSEPVRPGIRPSLLLDFANTKQLDPRITYTRASTATFYNGVTTAMAEQNLFSYSQDFSNAYWVKTVTTITANATTAPDGTSTASSFPAITSGTLNALTSGSTVGTSGQPLIISIFAKANTASFLQITPATAILASSFANFDLSTGTAGSIAGTGLTSSITSVGNGWYRCVVTIASSSGTGAIVFSLVDSNTSARQSAYTGTAGNNIFIWGAQAEQRSAVSAYTVTTTQAITNYIPALQTAASGVARFDHNPTTDESLGLLIEESKTNLVTYSEQFDNAAWTKARASITANTIVAPDGTLNGDKLVEDTTSTNTHYIFKSAITVSNATAYTFTVYAKSDGTRNWIGLYCAGSTATDYSYFDLTTGALGTVTANATASITSVGNGWYRCSVTVTTNSTSLTVYTAIATGNNQTSYTGNGFSGVYLWGAQLEAGAFATSYIPTVASQVTRAADSATMTGTNFSTWYAAGEWTLYAEIENRNGITSLTNYHAATISDGTNANSQLIRIDGVNNRTASFGSYNGTANQWTFSDAIIAKGSFAKITLGYAFNNVGFASNAGTVLTDSVAQISVQNLLTIGGGPTNAQPTNGCIKKVAYYPMRVINAQLQGMTTV